MDKKLAQTLADVFELLPSEVHHGITRESVASWDSLRQMDLVVSLERDFNISLEMEDILKMTSVSSIIQVLLSKGVEIEN
jgi:acyl carrier protein